jgi:hypothetical protein
MRIRSVVVASLVALGCSDPAGPGDLSIVVASSASAVHAGDKVTVTVTVLNTGSRGHVLTVTGCPKPFHVFAPDGNRVIPGEICSSPPGILTLERGDSYSFTFDWTAETTTFSGGTTVKHPLAPGRYALRGAVVANEFGLLVGGLTSVDVLP